MGPADRADGLTSAAGPTSTAGRTAAEDGADVRASARGGGRPLARRAVRPAPMTLPVRRSTALIIAVPLLLVLGTAGVAVGRRWGPGAGDAVILPAPRTSWQYEVHLVVPLPTTSPYRDDAVSTLTLLEDRLRPELAAAGARLDADDEGDREFSIVAVGDDAERLAGLLAARARGSVPAGTRIVTYRWSSDGSVGRPLRAVPLGDVPTVSP